MIALRALKTSILYVLVCALPAWAGIDGSIAGSVVDPQGVALGGLTVQLLTPQGAAIRQVTTSPTGEFQIFPVVFGDYELRISTAEFAPFKAFVHVNSGSSAQVTAQLASKASGKEMVLEVKAKRRLIQNSSSASGSEMNKDQIKAMPQGSEISLPKLLATTTPGAVQGPFGQTFFRGNHANIQYQIDGVQLPDSPSNTFGQAFSPRNIDHMEVITGGIPAEYGERLAAVVNIVTKSGPEVAGGEAEVNYGSYNTISPHLMYGGSTKSGALHYFASANYNQTDRGLDTPEPANTGDQKTGGTEANHDRASGNSEFVKLDWQLGNEDKLSFIVFNAQSKFQIPNYPSAFKVTDAFFQPGFKDQFGNGGNAAATTFNFVPSNTDDAQSESNAYGQVIWKHTVNEHTFLQVAPYYKYSAIQVTNDPANDLATSASGRTPVTGSSPSSFFEDKKVNNFGLKSDLTNRWNESHLVKVGLQAQQSRSEGKVSVQTDLATPAVVDESTDTGYFESVYVQDDYAINRSLTLNAGLRFDATQFSFAGLHPTDSSLQPRLGLSYLITDTTKVHAFYGKLFQPAPVENLRDTFVSTGAGQLKPYDIKAEKDDYYEVGIAQQILDKHVALVNVYYKDATNMLDDAQLLNTSIAQPYNFATGYAYGAEFSLKGEIDTNWSDFFNYSFEVAKGKGISGGIFAFPAGTVPSTEYQFLDHVQTHTANAGVTYTANHLWWTTQGLYGSGLRTGPNNSLSLPGHFSADTTVGYDFKGADWWTTGKVSVDVLNLLDNPYAISVANGFNGSHYAAGRQFFLRLTKEL